jgi:APA family basic amino acid/polyamine antiporter
MAILLVTGITTMNHLSIKGGSGFQLISTIVKVLVIFLLITGIFVSGNGSTENFFHAADPAQGISLMSGMVAAMTGAFFAYDGWINVSAIAGEIKRPEKNISRSLITGVFTCIVIYVLINQAYLYVLPVEQMAGSSLVAADAIAVAWGANGAAIIAALIVICTIGSVNGNIFATCRITQKMGEDKTFFPWAGKIHSTCKTPCNALWLHAIWICLFILTGSFDMLADMFVFVTWVAYLFGAIGIFVLRKKMPDVPRPYKTWSHPVVSALFILFSAFFLGVTIWNDITNYFSGKNPVINSLLGLAITALGIPLYFYYRKRGKNKTPENFT